MYEALFNEALDRLLRDGVPLEKARFKAHTIVARLMAVTKRLVKGA